MKTKSVLSTKWDLAMGIVLGLQVIGCPTFCLKWRMHRTMDTGLLQRPRPRIKI